MIYLLQRFQLDCNHKWICYQSCWFSATVELLFSFASWIFLFLNHCCWYAENLAHHVMHIAKVLALHKKGNMDAPENYRPISLLPTISKIFEKIIYKRMVNFISKNKLFSCRQFGFRSKRSNIHAITEIIENIRLSMYNKNPCASVFLDITKAFDTIDHSLFLNKLESFGVRGHFEKPIQSYLNNRQQYVFLQSKTSEIKILKMVSHRALC